MSEYTLIINHKGKEHRIEGASIEGVMNKARSEYPKCQIIRLESKGAENVKDHTS